MVTDSEKKNFKSVSIPRTLFEYFYINEKHEKMLHWKQLLCCIYKMLFTFFCVVIVFSLLKFYIYHTAVLLKLVTVS